MRLGSCSGALSLNIFLTFFDVLISPHLEFPSQVHGEANGSNATQFDKEQTKSKLFLSYGDKLQPQDVIVNVAQVVMAYFIF